MNSKIVQAMVLVVISVSLACANGVMASEEGGQSPGATVKGQITFTGPVPPTETVSVRRDAKFCGQTIERFPVAVAPDSKGVASVVVSVEGISSGPTSRPRPKPAPLVNQDCQFTPHTQVVMVNSQLEISSVDPILHNTHIHIERRTFLNIALPPNGRIIRKPLKKAGRLDVRCDAHKFMRSSIHVFQHPYFSLTDQNGTFEISHVPAGTYQLHIWHETFGLQKHSITVPSSGHVAINIDLKNSP